MIVKTSYICLLLSLIMLVPYESLALTLSNSSDLFDQKRSNRVDQKNIGRTSSPESLSPKWSRNVIDTTAGADFLTAEEKAVIIEINMVRTDPAAYASIYLEPLRAYYSGKLIKYPGEMVISTNEGVRALNESIKVLKNTKPLHPLAPKKGLTLCARDHVRDQAKTGETGHEGSDGSDTFTRMSRYGKWNSSAGENISYGTSEARKIVTSLLIDDGVPSRGHRKNLLDRSFNFVGSGVGPHKAYNCMCVIDFAGFYE